MAKQSINLELGVVEGLGVTIKRSKLHQDPFQNMQLEKEHKEMLDEMAAKLKGA